MSEGLWCPPWVAGGQDTGAEDSPGTVAPVQHLNPEFIARLCSRTVTGKLRGRGALGSSSISSLEVTKQKQI